MFQKIQELIEDSDALICVLIDEVSHGMIVVVELGFYLLGRSFPLNNTASP